MRDGEGDIIELTEGEDGALSYGTTGSMLDKYDAEGYRYIYVVREYMTGGTVQYEQVFDEVDEDGAVSGRRGRPGRQAPEREHLPLRRRHPQQPAHGQRPDQRDKGLGRLCLPGGVQGRQGRADPAVPARGF